MKKIKHKRKSAQSSIRSEREILSFVNSAWGDIAALTYRKFLEKGKGALVLNIPTATPNPLEPGGYNVEAKYFALSGGPMPEELSGFSILKTIEQIAGYDPEHEIILLVLRSNREVSSYTVKGEPKPPEAFLSQFSAARPKTTARVNFN